MLKGNDTNGRINVHIHPVAKARIMAACEEQTRRTGNTCTLTRHLNDYGWSLPALPKELEDQLKAEHEHTRRNGDSPPHRKRRPVYQN